MDEDELPLAVTPSFKSRASKGKARATPRAPAASAGGSNGHNVGDDNAASASVVDDVDDNDDAGNASAVVFKRSSSKNKGKSLLGGATTASTSSTRKAAPGTSSKSRLNVSFGGEDVGNDEANATGSSRASSMAASAAAAEDGDDGMDGDLSVSEVRKTNRRNRKLGSGIGSSSLSKAAEKALSNSLSHASIASLADRAASAPSQAGPSYSNDYLNQLKAANVTKSIEQPPPDSFDDSMALGGNGATYNDTALARYGTSIEDDDFTITGSSNKILPSDNAIAAAKLRRETARRLGVDESSASRPQSDDYISLQVGLPSSKRESRLVREEDELGEGEDDFSQFTGAEERIALGKKGRKAMERKRKEEMRALIEGSEEGNDSIMLLGGNGAKGVDLESDEEEKEWEMAQIRRGEQRRGMLAEEEGEPYRAANIPEQTSLPTLFGTSKRLKNALSDLETLKLTDEEHLTRSEAELSSLLAQESDLKNQVEATNAKFEFFAELKAYIQDIASFLQVKFPLLERMENNNVAFMKERTQEIVGKRRLLDDSDDVSLFTGVGIRVDLGNTEKKKSEDDGDMQAEDPEENEVDEMGRSRREDDIEPKSLARRTRRQERGRRRALASEQSNSSNTANEEEGYSTDDNLLPSDAADLRAAGMTLLDQREKIFEDVESEEFKDPNLGVKVKFLDWKQRYPQDYRDAFAGLSLVQAWEFWIRVEMASWNPFEIKELLQSPQSLDAYSWHASLTRYHEEAEALDAATARTGNALSTNNEDDNVVNAAVATIISPHLRKLALEAYDPFSRRMTSRALYVIEEISYCLETNSPRFQYLVQGFLSRFQTAIHNFQQLIRQAGSAIAQPETSFDTESIQARQRFLQRQLKLLSNGVKWKRYAKNTTLPQGSGPGAGTPFDACLASELVGQCMLPVIEAAWDTGGRDVAQQVLTVVGEGSSPPDVARRLRGL